jgi:hypothetical protein
MRDTLVALLLLATAGAAPFEMPRSRAVRDVLPSEIVTGAHYRIDERVLADGYMHHFTVRSEYGAFDVTGERALGRLLDEIKAITTLRGAKNLAAYGVGLRKAETGGPSFTRSLISHPTDTVTGLPRGLYEIVEHIGSAEATREARKFSAWKRDHAARLGVDPYSSNKALQKELNALAWAATAGEWSVSLLDAPSDAPARPGTAQVPESLRTALRQEPAARLRALNDEKLAAGGIAKALRTQFLDHPEFSPTHDTIIAEAILGLGSVAGRSAFLQAALTAQDEAHALFYVTASQILRGYHQSVAPLREIRAVGQWLIVGRSTTGVGVIPLPADHLLWMERVDDLLRTVKAAYRPEGFKGRFEVWTPGRVSARAHAELAQRGFSAVERLGLKIPIFY